MKASIINRFFELRRCRRYVDIKMNTNFTQNSTLNQLSYNQLWAYVSALSLIVCVLVVMVGNVLVIIDIRRKTFRTLTADLLTQLLLCDMVLMLFLPLVAATSLLTDRWIFGDTFCIVQGMVIQIVSTVSYIIRMMLAFERLSFVRKRRGMKISVGMGLAVSFIFLCVAVLIAVYPAGQNYHIINADGLHSCYLSEEWQPISKNLAVLSAPCVMVVIVSIISMNKLPLCKSGIIGPTELPKNQDSGNSTKLLYLGSADSKPVNTFRHNSAEIYTLYPESAHDVFSTSPESEISSDSVCISMGETRATSLLSMLNIAITATVVIRLGFVVASQRVPDNETFRTFILVCYVISCIIQTVALLTTSSRFQSAVRPVMLKPQPSTERKETVVNDQPFVVLVPRDEMLGMPTFLKTQPDMNIIMNLSPINDHNRNIRRLSMPDDFLGSSISVNIDRDNTSNRRRVTISVS